MGKDALARKPDIYNYHDYRQFLRDHLSYLDQQKKGYSLRQASVKAGLAVSYLGLVVRGSRNLTIKASDKLIPILKLNPSEQSYFKQLTTLGDTSSPEERIKTLQKIQRFRAYQSKNPQEIEVYKYLTAWYYVAIRELSGLPDFQLNAKWIQARLKKHVPIGKIEEALDFLLEHKFIELDDDGNVLKPKKPIECENGVYRVALSKFHREMFSLAADSFDDTDRKNRTLYDYTARVSEEDLRKINAIVETAMKEITAVVEEKTPEPATEVYNISMATFPLTKKTNMKVKKPEEEQVAKVQSLHTPEREQASEIETKPQEVERLDVVDPEED